ncbi:carbohydrate ABC transporter permease [Martelella mediterranea]|uniref:Raffinose/stachyose/melibiose transport system permease protein n=1 Tax=Martelella mediterranea TaxID=293089 RepID=A0A4R3NJ66_9HYPH|nr:carbohydrate ABC transporter permease [Martelella mediterranea]TCT33063.1 raffinose/stachyose/melibiose transport system permease protein [Martelella mediterranea]
MRRLKRNIFLVVVVALLLVQLFPILWLLLSSFKPSLALTSAPFSIGTDFTLANYAGVLRDSDIFIYIRNTAIVTFISIALIVILSAGAGFALEIMEIRLNGPISTLFLVGIMIPIQVSLIPLFSMYRDLHLLNSYDALILPQVGFALPLSILIFQNFYRYIPRELIEAAVIDGCNIYQMFFRVLLPLMKNVTLTVASLQFVFIWNDFVFSNTFTNSTQYKTIAVGLQEFIGAFGATDWGQTYAAICISLLPVLLIYLLLNKQMMEGIAAGAVKG